MPNIAALVTVAAVMFAVLGAITLIAHIYNLNNIKSKTVGDGQHGTARWANKAEIRKTYRHIPFTPRKWRKQAKQNQNAYHSGDSTEKTAPEKDRADRRNTSARHCGRVQGRQAQHHRHD